MTKSALALAIVASHAPAAISPARRQLAAHLAEIAAAGAALDHARLPFNRILAEIRIAETTLRDAQARRAESNLQAARAIARGDAAAAPLIAGRRHQGDDIAGAEQAVADAKAAAGLVEPSIGAAESRLAALQSQTDALVIAVMVELGDVARGELGKAQADALAAEVKFAAWRAAVAEHAAKLRATGGDAVSWLRAAESMAYAHGAMLRPEMTNGDMQRGAASWAAIIAALPNDPTAAVT